ncbi:MAG: endonuclease I [Bdellovibrionales bacterium]|jgi:deoxyribonuclease I|nr:endonuclease I [Bdellovibrionales bacterium]MBT3526359.1 endonuclease I [Bdellovibrionales bacterium]MBT7765618.1 endonuclease I [Bdellovibrionales bacterium]
MKRCMIFILLWPLLTPVYLYGEVGDCATKWKQITDRYSNLGPYQDLINLCGDQLRDPLRKIVLKNKRISYTNARKHIFSTLDNIDGVVCSIYIDACIKTNRVPNSNVMNTEHLWPQSRGATGIAKSDLHHLRPANSRVNSRRGNYPFCQVETIEWEKMGSYYGKNSDNRRCFEPRDLYKGDIARAMLYFSIRYKKYIDPSQEQHFRLWHQEDPPEKEELIRNDLIENIQKNRNPFVDIPELVELIEDF